VDPVPDPLLLRKSGSAGDRTRDLCISSQIYIYILPVIQIILPIIFYRYFLFYFIIKFTVYILLPNILQ